MFYSVNKKVDRSATTTFTLYLSCGEKKTPSKHMVLWTKQKRVEVYVLFEWDEKKLVYANSQIVFGFHRDKYNVVVGQTRMLL